MVAKVGYAGARISFDTTRNVLTAFPTPIINTAVANSETLNEGLRRIVLAKESENPGLDLSNMGGWHSEADLLKWPEPEIKALASFIDTLVRQMAGVAVGMDAWKGKMTYEAWANVNRRGHHNRMHNHPGAHWSGIYYVDPGDRDPSDGDSGKIEFPDPRSFAQMTTIPGNPFGRQLTFRPRAGQILIFPSFLNHTVHTYDGEGARISIAFNANMGRAHPDQTY
jgi:uncharacterized protein (TIGR02466 family)